jgi:hypothetical protein
MTQDQIVAFAYTATAHVVDIAVFKRESDTHFLVVSDASGATYHYDLYDHTTDTAAATASHTVTPSPVSDDSRPRGIDLKWDGSDLMIRIENNGNFVQSTGYLSLNSVSDQFSYIIPSATQANEVKWVPFTDLAAIATHDGKVIFTSAITDQKQDKIYTLQHASNNELVRFYTIPRTSNIAVLFYKNGDSRLETYRVDHMGCHNPLALTCEAKNKAKSLTCKPEAALQTFDKLGDQCYCNEGFYYDIATRSCQQCSASCTTNLCNGPDASDCLYMTLEKTSDEIFGIGFVDNSQYADSDFFSGLLEFHGNVGKAYSLSLDSKQTTVKRTFEDTRSEGIDGRDSATQDIKILAFEDFGILFGSNIRRVSLDSNKPNLFENFQLSNNFGSYHTFSRLVNSNFLVTAMNVVSNVPSAANTPTKFFRFNLQDPSEDPIEWTTNRNIRSLKYSRFTSNYIFVIFNDHNPPYDLSSNPSRQIFSGLANVNNTNPVATHEYEHYDIDLAIEVVDDATDTDGEFTMLLLSYPNYLYRRRVSDGLERDFKLLDLFGENLLEHQDAIAMEKIQGTSHAIIQSFAGRLAVWNYHDDSWLDDIRYLYVGGLGQRKGVMLHDMATFLVPTKTKYTFVPISGLRCTFDILTETCEQFDRSSSASCKSGSNSELITYTDFLKERKYCRCKSGFEFSTETNPGTCVPTGSATADRLCLDPLAATCTDNTYEGTVRCRGLAHKNKYTNRCFCPVGTYQPSPGEDCVKCPNFPTSCAGPTGAVETSMNKVYEFSQRLPYEVRIHGACPIEVETYVSSSLDKSFYGFMTLEAKDINIWKLDLSQPNDEDKITLKTSFSTIDETQPFGQCVFSNHLNSVFSIGQYFRKTDFNSGTENFVNADIAVSNYQNDGSIQDIVKHRPDTNFWFFASSNPVSQTTTEKKIYRFNANSIVVDQFGVNDHFLNDFDVDNDSDFIIQVFQYSGTTNGRQLARISNLADQTKFDKPQADEEMTVVVLQGIDFYSVTYGSTLKTYEFIAYENEAHTL